MNEEYPLRSAFPGTFFLTDADVSTISDYLAETGWVQRDERVEQVTRAGEGNMNCVLRIVTSQRSFILKQSRPWVAKYPNIPAPWNRAAMEARFYRQVEENRAIAIHIPELVAFDPSEQVLMLEDLEEAHDFTFLYSLSDSGANSEALETLTAFLIALHTSFCDPNLATLFANEEMRRLNHEHIFALPLRIDNGLNLDAITPGFSQVARQLQADDRYCQEITLLAQCYLANSRGTCLLHGDYFPGSWLAARHSVYVIDPEFCFYGPPEWDVGVMVAHLHLAGQHPALIEGVLEQYGDSTALNKRLMNQFAGVEIMRRLMGVAQLPIPYGLERKTELLELSKTLVLENSRR